MKTRWLVGLWVFVWLFGCNDAPKTLGRVCEPADHPSSKVGTPKFVRNVSNGNTGWYASPAVVDLDGDGRNELVGAFYDIGVWDSDGNLLSAMERGDHKGRVYAPEVVADLDGDGVMEVVVAAGEGTVAAYEWRNGGLVLKHGWPASTCANGQCPENRSIAAADLDGDGRIEIVVGSTQTEGEGHVFVFSPDGSLFRPAGLAWPAWPRYNTNSGPGGDVDVNCSGQHGYGMYGLNLGIGNLDDDSDLEIVATYDNHQIQVFNLDGSTLLTDQDFFTNRSNDCEDQPMSWGQFIHYIDPEVENNHYHLHQGKWPGPDWTLWAQFTKSPPSVADVDGDGLNEVVVIPNAEQDEPYHTYHHAFFVLRGDQVIANDPDDPSGDGHGATRLAGWEHPPLTEEPLPNDDWYPPDTIPAPTVADIGNGPSPEILAPIDDGYVYAFDAQAKLLWRYDYTRGKPLMYASEVVVADLNGDGSPEIIFGTYGEDVGDGHLVILSSGGDKLYDVKLSGQRANGNGIGVAAAPTVADLDGDGTLEIVLLTIDHGMDVYTIPGSFANCMPWPTGRANYLRNGMGPATQP
ncbi:MAG: VCBS repeat-containing protein [Deltaproteobacteria bacterium]|nr:VCBS repeat-containing protein [Deltaproteobacteria bacterium]